MRLLDHFRCQTPKGATSTLTLNGLMVFFLMIGMSVQDQFLGIMMMVNGLAFLVGAGVYWLTHRVEQAELATREKLLQLELQLAELCERLGAH